MADQRLSELEAAETVTDDALLYVVQSGQSRRAPRSALLAPYRRLDNNGLVVVDLGDVTDATIDLGSGAQLYRARLVGDGVLTLVLPDEGHHEVRLDLVGDDGTHTFAFSCSAPVLWLNGNADGFQPPAGTALVRFYLTAGPDSIEASVGFYWDPTP